MLLPTLQGPTSTTFIMLLGYCAQRPTVCVSPARSLRGTGAGAGVDSAWEQYKLEARKLLENAADSHLSSARGVRRFFDFQQIILIVQFAVK